MADIIHFTPRAELDAEGNLRGFIEVCRNQLTAFGKHLRFEEDVWDVTDALDLKAKRGKQRLVFSTWATVNQRAPCSMADPFLSFAKAYMRYQHALRPTKSVGCRVAALRALEAALLEFGSCPDPTAVSPQTLNRASQLISEGLSSAVAYRVGGQLEMVAGFLVDQRILNVPVRWRSPIRRPRDTVRVGKEFDEQRSAKLPSPASLDALGKVFQLASEPLDVLVSSVAAILCSAPDRINEVLHLEVDCEVAQKVPSTGATAYGLRCCPSKGADPMVKWIVASMASVVQDAVGKIRRLTQDARAIATWYEEHPGRLFLPQHLEHLRHNARLSMAELGEVLFTRPPTNSQVHQWCRNHVVKIAGAPRNSSVAFVDVERVIVAMLPRGFPIANAERRLKYSNALCLVQRNALHPTRGTYRCAVYLVSQGDIGSRLGGGSEFGKASIFDRFGFREDDGSPIRINTHQFRHYLNTLAQTGGMSQLDIAKWSGRVEVSQNKVYDHQSDRDILALVRHAVGDERRMFGPLATAHKVALIPRNELARLKVQTAHTTPFGYCIHDFTMLPCQIHGDCLNCDEAVCIKGDAVKEADIRLQREETRALLKEAESADAEGYAGANRWVAHQKLTLSRLDQLCAIFDDPQVPVGAVIQASGIVPASRLEQAANRRRLLQIGTNQDRGEGSAASLPTPESITNSGATR